MLVLQTEKARILRSGEGAKRLGFLYPLTARRWVKEGNREAVQNRTLFQ